MLTPRQILKFEDMARDARMKRFPQDAELFEAAATMGKSVLANLPALNITPLMIAQAVNPRLWSSDDAKAHLAASPRTVESARRASIENAHEIFNRLFEATKEIASV